ncbi:sensor histidine kinase [Oceanibacterium hippocampi]|nr:PAS domain S-box protein [Oceanibacterium hippocampi]
MLLVFVPLAVATAAILYMVFYVQSGAIESVTRSNQEKAVEIGRQRLEGGLASVSSDVRYLARQQALQRWLVTRDPGARQELVREYLAFAAEKKAYDQIRVLDLDGREMVRINWNAGDPTFAQDDQLQNKVRRYYVDETLKLGPGQVYMSPFDLNVEHGVVETPVKPTLRFGAAIFDADGQKRGIIILNYLGQRLLDRLEANAVRAPGQLWLLNADGYWMLGPSAEDEWAFMYEDRHDRSFAGDYPDAWAQMGDAAEAGQLIADGELFTYARVAPISEAEEPDATGGSGPNLSTSDGWILITHLPTTALERQRSALARNLVYAAVALALLLAMVSFVIARHGARRREDELRIRDSEARFRTLLEAAPDSVVIIDPDGRIELVNAQTERLFGHPRDRLIGEPVEMLVPDRFRDRHIGHRGTYLTEPRARPMGAALELFGLRSDGTEFPVAISLSPVQTADGTLIVADIRDVTEQRQAELRIKELNERLFRDNAEIAAVNKELEAFSYSVSHDLRAPLRAIDGFSQALLEDCADGLDDTGRSHLNRVRQAAQRMGQLIDDLLKLSRVTRSDLSEEELDLSALARTVADTLRTAHPVDEAEIGIADGLSAVGDPRLLRIALENLFGNAWKFTAGRAPRKIEFGRAEHAGEPVYFIRDNGVGFDMTYADQLFRAFQRLHDARSFAGTGIGLATVQRIIHKHGGRIWAEAEVDKGATFYFTLQA